MRTFLGYILFLLIPFFLWGQPQNTQRFHWWHFGDGWTLDFNSTPPVHAQNSAIDQFEGCATVSDGAGRLLFYTDGMTVWQRNNLPMPNGQGLLGDDGSTMSAIITPVIGNRDQYYIFTVDGTTTLPNNGPNGRFDGLHYSVVDMSLNGGFGQVVQKNIPLVDSTTEKVIALKGANEREYWIVTQLYDKSQYHAYKVDCAGINTTPVVSNSGLPVSGTVSYGFMKPSHNGELIASIVTDTNFFGLPERVELLDFDRNTGILSNPRPVTGTGAAYYGLEFSPNDSVLYVGDISNQRILSYDPYTTNIPATQQLVHNYGILGADIGALQLGPDDQIYIKKFNTLDLIQNPNNRNAPGFQSGAINLLNASIFNPTLGLPAWFDIWPAPITAPDTTICKGFSTPIGVSSIPGFTYSWSPANSLNDPNLSNPIATPSATTTYTLLATFAGCTDTAFVTVKVLGDTTFISSSLGHFNWCPNRQNTLTLNGLIPVQWIKDGQLIAGATTSSIIVSGPGLYQIAATDSCGNPDTLSVDITPQPPNAQIAPGDTLFICQGDVQPLFAQGGQVIEWLRDGQPLTGTNPVRAVTQQGLYQVVIEDTCGLRDTAFSLVQFYPGPDIQFAVPDTALLCPGGSLTISATGGQPISWRRNNVLIPGATDTFLVVNQIGQYSLIMKDSLGCRDTGTITVLSYATLDSLILTPDTAICLGDSVRLSTLGGGFFSWQPSNSLSCSNCPAPIATPTSTTAYTVTLTDPLGCSVTDSITITVLQLPNVMAGPDTSLCPGEAASLHATGALQYQWLPSTNLSCSTCPDPTVLPTQSTSFTVIGTDAAGCSASDTVSISVLTPPTVSIVGTDTICQGDSLQLSGTGAASYTWFGSDLSCFSCAAPMASPDSTSTYQVVGIGNNGCSDTATGEIVVFSAASLQMPNDTVICPGTSVTLTSAFGGTAQSIQWSPAAGLSCQTCLSPTASPVQRTTYILTVTTVAGCIVTDSVTVDIASIGSLNISPDTIICAGNTGQLRASGGQQYLWSPATGLSCTNCPDPVIIPSSSQTYTVTASDANGCILSDSVDVSVTPGPSLQVFGNTLLCEGDTTALQVQGANTYTWSPGTSLTCDNCPTPGAFPSQTTTYTVQGSDVNGCSSFDSIRIDVQQEQQVMLQGDTAICRGDTATWIVNGLNTYFWQPVSGVSCATCDTISLSPQSTRLYTLSGIGQNGCPVDTTFRLTVGTQPNVTVTLSSATACAGESIQMAVTGADTYSWSPGSFLDCTNCDTVIATPPQSFSYTVVGTTNEGCTNTVQANLTIFDNPTINLPSDTTVCRNQPIELAIDSFSQVSWSSGLNLSCINCAQTSFIASTPDLVQVAITDSNGCSALDSMQILLFPDYEVTAGPDTTICEGDSVIMLATPGQQFSWEPAAVISNASLPNPTAFPVQTTVFTVVGIDLNGCTDTTSTTVQVRPSPFVDAGPDITLFEGESAILQGQGAGTPLWSPTFSLSDVNSFTPTVSLPADSLLYVLTVQDAIGCAGSDSVWVRVLVPEVITVPNAFSPNGDGQNDYFNIPALQYYTLESLQIFNRWGQLLFETADNTPGWDGRYLGQPQPTGTYIYQIRLQTPSGLPVRKQGNVTLFR